MSRSVAVRWLASFFPAPVSVRWQERARSCLGALLGIAFTGDSMSLLSGKFTPLVAYLDGWLRNDPLPAPTAGGVMTQVNLISGLYQQTFIKAHQVAGKHASRRLGDTR